MDCRTFVYFYGMHYTDKLESERLTTRFLTMNDIPTWAAFFRDADTTALHKPTALSPEEQSAMWIDFAMKRYAENRLGLQALILKDTGALIGQCGLLAQTANGQAVTEIGYHLLRPYWGKGYAIEAARLFRDYGFSHNFDDAIVSLILPENNRSQQVAIRNGMTLYDRDTEFRGEHYHMYRIRREEWEQIH